MNVDDQETAENEVGVLYTADTLGCGARVARAWPARGPCVRMPRMYLYFSYWCGVCWKVVVGGSCVEYS